MKKSNKLLLARWVAAALAVGIMAGSSWLGYRQLRRSDQAVVEIGGTRVLAEVADTTVKRAKGLIGHAPLGPNDGMIFVFETPDRYGFWMRDMVFPIDIIWIRDGRIVHIEERVPVPVKGEILPTYTPLAAADTVLEVQAGFAEAHSLKIGDSVEVK